MKSIRTVLTVGVVALLLAAVAVPALAGHQGSGVQSYTGCITTLHKLVKVAVGDVPSGACALGQTQVHVSGGDITSVTAGTGLNISEGDLAGTTVTGGAVTLTNSIHLVTGTGVSVANGADGTSFASCAATEIAVGGGVRWDPVTFPATGLTVELAGPSARADGTFGAWRVDGHNASGVARTLTAFATCMKA